VQKTASNLENPSCPNYAKRPHKCKRFVLPALIEIECFAEAVVLHMVPREQIFLVKVQKLPKKRTKR
jgi:hypothetical protein